MAGEVCGVIYQFEDCGSFCCGLTSGHDGPHGDEFDKRAGIETFHAQLKAAEAGLHRAWEEGRAAGWRDRSDRGNDEYALPPKLTENPYPDPEVNHAPDD